MREDCSLSSAGGNLNGVQGEPSATALNRLARDPGKETEGAKGDQRPNLEACLWF